MQRIRLNDLPQHLVGLLAEPSQSIYVLMRTMQVQTDMLNRTLALIHPSLIDKHSKANRSITARNDSSIRFVLLGNDSVRGIWPDVLVMPMSLVDREREILAPILDKRNLRICEYSFF
jgi:hypothetical protein